MSCLVHCVVKENSTKVSKHRKKGSHGKSSRLVVETDFKKTFLFPLQTTVGVPNGVRQSLHDTSGPHAIRKFFLSDSLRWKYFAFSSLLLLVSFVKCGVYVCVCVVCMCVCMCVCLSVQLTQQIHSLPIVVPLCQRLAFHFAPPPHGGIPPLKSRYPVPSQCACPPP